MPLDNYACHKQTGMNTGSDFLGAFVCTWGTDNIQGCHCKLYPLNEKPRYTQEKHLK